MLKLNEDVYFIQGAKNGAIYDLINEKVYSINSIACKILMKFHNKNNLSDNEMMYIGKLKQMGIISQYNTKEITSLDINGLDMKINMVWLEVTQSCNLKCVHCYEGDNHIRSNKSISVEDWEKIIDEIGVLKIPNVVIIGGEPCLFNELLYVLKRLVYWGTHITIITNATIIPDEIKEYIISNRTLITVKVSIYGPNASIHEAVTKVEGSFSKMCSNIDFLIKNKVRVYAAVIAMKENQDFLEETQKFIEKLGVKYTRYDVIRSVYGGKQDCHVPDREDVIKHGLYTKANFKVSRNKFFSNIIRNSCWYGKIVITETGDYLPCVFERKMILGNIKEYTLSELLESDKLDLCWGITMDHIQICRDCEYKYACKDCRPVATSIDGNYYNKNPKCLYNPYRGVWNE